MPDPAAFHGVTSIVHSNGTTERFDQDGKYLSSSRKKDMGICAFEGGRSRFQLIQGGGPVDLLARAVADDERSSYLMGEFAKTPGFRLVQRQLREQKLSSTEYMVRYSKHLRSFLKWFLQSGRDRSIG